MIDDLYPRAQGHEVSRLAAKWLETDPESIYCPYGVVKTGIADRDAEAAFRKAVNLPNVTVEELRHVAEVLVR
jgi:DNA uptake protein ComE-like DNA-binding protein